MRLSTNQLCQKGINAFKDAMKHSKDGSIEMAELSFSAARTWANRAEYSIKYDFELSESDFEFADQQMLRPIISDSHYAKLTPLQLDELADDQ